MAKFPKMLSRDLDAFSRALSCRLISFTPPRQLFPLSTSKKFVSTFVCVLFFLVLLSAPHIKRTRRQEINRVFQNCSRWKSLKMCKRMKGKQDKLSSSSISVLDVVCAYNYAFLLLEKFEMELVVRKKILFLIR